MCSSPKPLVSLIVPAYNVENYIEQAISSVLNQTYKQIELIVVDDGSSDRTYSRAAASCGLDSRCHIVRRENEGVSKARNVCLDICKGEYVYFLDGDDWLPSDAINNLMDAARHNNSDIVLTHSSMQMPNGTSREAVVPLIAQEDLYKFGPVACGYPTHICNFFFKRDAIGNIRFNISLCAQEDTDFALSVCSPGLQYAYCNVATYNYRIGRVGSTLTTFGLREALSMKSVRKKVLDLCSADAPGNNSAREYGASCFGVLRRSAPNAELYYSESRIPEDLKGKIRRDHSIKTIVVLFTSRHPHVMRPLFYIMNHLRS